MNPGKLDRRVVIQTRALTKDAAGGRIETWSDSYDCWAEALPQKAREEITADADRSIDERQFRIRYRAALASGNHRLLYQLKFYDITAITEEGRQHMLVLTCRATQALTHV